MTEEATKDEPAPDLHTMLQSLAKSMAETEIEQLPVSGLDRNSNRSFSPGDMVKIRPCGADDKTYLGMYLGTFAIDAFLAKKKDTNEDRRIVCVTNPAIFVPALKKVVFGAESWWGPIKNEAELKAITNEEIDSLWYVQALKAQAAAQAETPPG